MALTAEQIAFFKTNGYLILEGALDPDLCLRALDGLWDSLPETSRMERDDPATHVGPFAEGDELEDATNLRKAHALIESGKAHGKIVLEGFGD